MAFPVEKQCRHLLKISFISGINSLHMSPNALEIHWGPWAGRRCGP